MDLLLVRSLMSAAEHGAITLAASHLGLTQPALSRRIQLLEEHFGETLLVRSRKGVSLTEMGRLVDAEGRAMVDRWERLEDSIRAHRNLEAGIVRIGGGATAVSFLLPEAIADFQRLHPGIRFQVKEAGSRDVEFDVVNEKLELGIVTLPVQSQWSNEFEVVPLIRDRIVPVAAKGHPVLREKNLEPSSLQGLGVVGFEAGSAIRQLVDSALLQAGVQMNILMELRSIPAILQMVSSTRSIGFVSMLSLGAADGHLQAVEVTGLNITRELAVISKRGRPLSSSAAAFARRLQR
jgi:DNA-binding transcriptional LysR family regulator